MLGRLRSFAQDEKSGGAESAAARVWIRQPAKTAPSLAHVRSLLDRKCHHRLLDGYEAIMIESGRLPRKSDFDPTVLRGDLSKVALYEITPERDVVFKLVGEDLIRSFGTNPTGRSYCDFVPAERAETAKSAFLACADTPCGMKVRTEQVLESGRLRLCDAIGLPLFPDESPIASHLLFIDDVNGASGRFSLERQGIQFTYLVERVFIDLGYGTPSGFEDLVPDRAA
ncbi:MAG: hypothetical protein NXI16_08000 [Alphaproteobacteria bacterium]|nr:hypothetical protein [Alphaproteobacteria bacterium]